MTTDNYLDTVSIHLSNHEIILHPMDTVWSFCWNVNDLNSFEKLTRVKPVQKEDPVILLVSSIDMLKKYVREVHPRIETLLSLHRRPVSIRYPDVIQIPPHLLDQKGRAIFRVVRHLSLCQIIDELNMPIASYSAWDRDSEFPIDYLQVNPSFLDIAHYTSSLKPGSNLEDRGPSVIAKYDKKGELDFIRE